MYVRDILSAKLQQFSSEKKVEEGSDSLEWIPDSIRAVCRSLKVDGKNWVIGVSSQEALYW